MNARESNHDRSPFLASLNAVPVCKQRMADTDWFPAVDVSDTGEEYLFEFDFPGLTLKEIQISHDQEALYLTGERKTLRHGGGSLRVERPAGTFVRRLPLPLDAWSHEIYAILQDGILELHVPKQTPLDEDATSCSVPSEELNCEHAHC